MKLPRIQRALKSMLIRVGDLGPVNSLGSVPPEFEYVANKNAYVGRSLAEPMGTTPDFTAIDVGAVVASSYDEVVVDTRPVVDSAGRVTTNGGSTPELYRSLLSANTPFWFVVRCTGYGQSSLYSRDDALTVAKKIVDALWADANAYTLTPLLKGFAFVSPDLNVVFPDGTAIDRLFQSALVQEAWTCFRAAMFITSRPNDVVTMVAPQFELPEDPEDPVNPNSGLPLAHPIIGSSPQHEDRIVALYPNLILDYPSISLIATQVQSFFSLRARDSGFPLNLTFGYVLPFDWTKFSPDSVMGVNVSGDGLSRVKNFVTFLATTGVSYVGLQSGPAGNSVPVPQEFFPEDDTVNSAGGAVVWSAAGKLYVAYPQSDGTTRTRVFSDQFEEQVP